MFLPADYNNRVYAGVLGKLIGVYLGRPLRTGVTRTFSPSLDRSNITFTIGSAIRSSSPTTMSPVPSPFHARLMITACPPICAPRTSAAPG